MIYIININSKYRTSRCTLPQGARAYQTLFRVITSEYFSPSFLPLAASELLPLRQRKDMDLPGILIAVLFFLVGLILIIGAYRRWEWLVDPPTDMWPYYSQAFLRTGTGGRGQGDVVEK